MLSMRFGQSPVMQNFTAKPAHLAAKGTFYNKADFGNQAIAL